MYIKVLYWFYIQTQILFKFVTKCINYRLLLLRYFVIFTSDISTKLTKRFFNEKSLITGYNK